MPNSLKRLSYFLAVLIALASVAARAAAPPIPAPTTNDALAQKSGKQTAVFAGGCFWGTQSVFEHVKGVLLTSAGYAGGSYTSATYDQVKRENTGHAESVRIVFDPSKITYGQLLQIFFSVAHDPTQLNRQGPDVGSSYRSVIFFSNEDQRKISADYIAQLDAAKVFPKPIVTALVQLKGFYDAEPHHQDYAAKNPDDAYIQAYDRPKIVALQQQFPDLFIPYKGK